MRGAITLVSYRVKLCWVDQDISYARPGDLVFWKSISQLLFILRVYCSAMIASFRFALLSVVRRDL